MKILERKDNDLFDIEYYDKITKQKIRLNDVSKEVVDELRKAKAEEKEYRKFANKHLVSLDELEEEGIEVGDESYDPCADLFFEEEEQEQRELKYQIYKGMRTLTLRQRQVFRMSFYESLSNIEIAERLGISQPRVSQILSEAELKLYRFLKKK